MGRLPDDYFEAIYRESGDPWRFAERWYEHRKYALTLAALPARRFRHAFEVGCSVGVLTAMLAERCDRVTAIDVSPAALRSAHARVTAAGHAGVQFERRSLDQSWPAGDVDLVLLSEVGYYLEEATLREVLDRETARLRPGTTIVAVHWRHAVADYPMTGDRVQDVVGATAGLSRAGSYRDADFALDLLTVGAVPSVATAEGVPGAAEA